MKKRVGILISGRGSNMEALVAASAAGSCPVEIAIVLSNNPDAPGLASAAQSGIVTSAIDHRPYRRDRAAHEMAIAHRLEAEGVEIVCLAGYMRLLTPLLVGRYAGRMLNVHPSLLPSFPGLHTHARAIAAGVKVHGCTVHLVTETMDEGPILMQAAVPVLPEDDEDTLAARVLAQEHRIYPMALALFAESQPGTAPGPDVSLCNPLRTPALSA